MYIKMKIRCSSCPALILAETAVRTGGLCMPCKSGTRANIEASKVEAQRERELDATDPFRIYWRDLVARVYKSSAGLTQLSDVERQYWAVACVSGEVYNGGFSQYFHNSSGATYSAAVDGLQSMGATTSLLLLQKAKQMIFGFAEVPEESNARRTILAVAESDSLYQRLDELDKQFWSDPDELAVRSEAFAVTQGLVRLV
jgi:hypothetical protein